jgi:beta-galactosidase/beta-glucuronidase
MRNRFFAIAALIALVAPAVARSQQPLDGAWRFVRADVPHAEAVAFDDAGWQTVELPHSFNAADGDDGGDYYRGPAWYRRHLALADRAAGLRAFLEFGAATLVADVYVNGRLVGRHEGGFAAFRFDVTKLLHPGDNLIAVRVDNTLNHTIAPIGGDFTVFGGLIRPVALIRTGALHFDLLDDGGPGVYLSTTKVEENAATIHASARLVNDSDAPASATLRLDVRDSRGRIAATASLPVTLARHQTQRVETDIRLSHPRLWDGVRDPYSYTVSAQVVAENTVADDITVPFGVRTFFVDPAKGFFLNGKPYDLHGVNYFHSERPGMGTAVGFREIDADYRLMRELGVSGVRFAHFQHPQRAYDDADKAGFVVWSEIPLNTEFDASPGFEASVRQQMREMIVQNFNHPAVVFWGLGNELRISNADSNRLLAAAQSEAKADDPSRPTAYAHCCLADDDPIALHADLAAFNRYWGLYEGPDTLDQIGPWADRLHAAWPHRAFAISEYGGCAGITSQEDPPSRPKPKSRWHPEQYQTKFHQAYWTQFESRPYLWAKFVWQMFDSASDTRRDGAQDGLNDKGLVTYARTVKKDAFYWYKANWSDRPFVYIASRRFTPRRQAKADIKVFTNLTEVTLTLNGHRVGTVAADGRVTLWHDVELRSGDNVATVSGRRGAVAAQDRVVWRFEATAPR